MCGMRSKKKTMRSLRFALKNRNVKTIRKVLGLKPNLRSPEGGRLLWDVIDNPEIASMLVLAGADLTVRHPTDQSSLLLWSSSRSNDERYLRLALLLVERGANVNYRTREGNTALHLAVKNDSPALADALVKRGLSVDIANIHDETAVSLAAKCSKAKEMVKLLVCVQKPVDQRRRNCRILNAIQRLICSESDETAAIGRLLELGANVNEPSDCGLTPLALALVRGKSNLLDLLVKFGSDMSKLSKQRNLPVIRGSYMEQSLITNLLLDQGASVNERDQYGRNRLHIVCACSKFMPLRNLQLLLHLGADAGAVDCWGNTPFSLMDADSLYDARKLFIKHLALSFWKGEVVSEIDATIVQSDEKAGKFYVDCLDELQRMTGTLICKDFTVFDVLARSLDGLTAATRDDDFVASYHREKWMFPMYARDLENAFGLAEIRRDILLAIERTVNKVTRGVLPTSAVQRIAYYVCIERFRKLEKEFYFALHAQTEARKPSGRSDEMMIVE